MGSRPPVTPVAGLVNGCCCCCSNMKSCWYKTAFKPTSVFSCSRVLSWCTSQTLLTVVSAARRPDRWKVLTESGPPGVTGILFLERYVALQFFNLYVIFQTKIHSFLCADISKPGQIKPVLSTWHGELIPSWICVKMQFWFYDQIPESSVPYLSK